MTPMIYSLGQSIALDTMTDNLITLAIVVLLCCVVFGIAAFLVPTDAEAAQREARRHDARNRQS